MVPIIFVYNFTDLEMSFFLFPTKYKRKIRNKYDFEDFRNIRVDKIEYIPIFKDLCWGISECYLFIFYFHPFNITFSNILRFFCHFNVFHTIFQYHTCLLYGTLFYYGANQYTCTLYMFIANCRKIVFKAFWIISG